MDGFKPFSFLKTAPSVFISGNDIRFSKTTVNMLNSPAYVQLLVNKDERKIAIKGVDIEDIFAVPFYSGVGRDSCVHWKSKELTKALFDIAGWDWSRKKSKKYKVFAFYDNSENALVIDLATAFECS